LNGPGPRYDCCYPIFDPCFDKFLEKNPKIVKNNKNPKKDVF